MDEEAQIRRLFEKVWDVLSPHERQLLRHRVMRGEYFKLWDNPQNLALVGSRPAEEQHAEEQLLYGGAIYYY